MAWLGSLLVGFRVSQRLQLRCWLGCILFWKLEWRRSTFSSLRLLAEYLYLFMFLGASVFLLAISQRHLSALRGLLQFLVMWPSPYAIYNLSAHFSKTSNTEIASRARLLGVLHNIIMRVTYFVVLYWLETSHRYATTHTQEEEIIERCEDQKAGTSGDHVRGCPLERALEDR